MITTNNARSITSIIMQIPIQRRHLHNPAALMPPECRSQPYLYLHVRLVTLSPVLVCSLSLSTTAELVSRRLHTRSGHTTPVSGAPTAPLLSPRCRLTGLTGRQRAGVGRAAHRPAHRYRPLTTGAARAGDSAAVRRIDGTRRGPGHTIYYAMHACILHEDAVTADTWKYPQPRKMLHLGIYEYDMSGYVYCMTVTMSNKYTSSEYL